jgi:hypothetical protein
MMVEISQKYSTHGPNVIAILKFFCKNLLALAFSASVIKPPLKMGLGS